MEVTTARLLSDEKSVFVGLADVKKVMQMEIAYDLETIGGEEIIGKLHNTIHRLRKPLK